MRRTVAGHGGPQLDNSAEQQAEAEFRQGNSQQQGQLPVPHGPVTPRASSQIPPLPPNAAPQHRHAVNSDGRLPQRSRWAQQRRAVVGPSSFQPDWLALGQADYEHEQAICPSQGQLQGPDDQAAHQVSNELLQPPPSAAPQHGQTVNSDGRSPQISRRFRHRHTVGVHGGFQKRSSAARHADVELQQEILQQPGQLQDPPDPVSHQASSQLLQLPSNTLPQGDSRSPPRSRRSQQRHTVVELEGSKLTA